MSHNNLPRTLTPPPPPRSPYAPTCMWLVSSQQEHILSFPGGWGLLYCMFSPWGHLTWTFTPMVCKLISVWINIWMSPLCFPFHSKPRQVASVLFLGSFAAASNVWFSVQRWRAYQRASSEREKPGCVGDSWPPVAAAASSTLHGCIYRAPWMSHLAPCPLFLCQIYGSLHRGGLLDLRRAPLSPFTATISPHPALPLALTSETHRNTILPPTKQWARHAAALSCASRWRALMSAMRRETWTWP